MTLEKIGQCTFKNKSHLQNKSQLKRWVKLKIAHISKHGAIVQKLGSLLGKKVYPQKKGHVKKTMSHTCENV